jgi:hypothetical protein
MHNVKKHVNSMGCLDSSGSGIPSDTMPLESTRQDPALQSVTSAPFLPWFSSLS